MKLFYAISSFLMALELIIAAFAPLSDSFFFRFLLFAAGLQSFGMGIIWHETWGKERSKTTNSPKELNQKESSN